MEIRDLYDENKILTKEIIKKGEKGPKGRYYITVVVWIQNNNNEFLIQKTSKEKGSYYSTTGGHPKSGETSIQGIVTEVKEELGLDINPKNLTLFKTIKTEDDFVDLYYLKQDIDLKGITLQKEEVEEASWMTQKEIESLIKNKQFLAPHIDFYKDCLEYLNSKEKVWNY